MAPGDAEWKYVRHFQPIGDGAAELVYASGYASLSAEERAQVVEWEARLAALTPSKRFTTTHDDAVELLATLRLQGRVTPRCLELADYVHIALRRGGY